jgi:hypothetical protein
LLVAIASFFLLSCTVDEDKLHRYAGENDSESIIEFMEDKDNRDYSLKLKAIDIIVKNKLKDGLKYLEVLFYEHDEVKFKMKIVQAFHKYNMNFRDSRKLYNYYMDINSRWESPYLKDDVKSILYNSFDKELVHYSDSLLQSALYSENYPLGYKILKIRSEFIVPDSVIVNIRPLIELIVTEPNSFSSVKSINSQIQLVVAELSKLDADYNEIAKRVEEESNNINSFKEELEKTEYYWISGIVVSEYSPRIYEVNIYGADTRAILNTNNTLFQTKGYFEMRVKKTGNYPMKIKDQYGGFTQVWPIYEELTSKDESNYNFLNHSIEKSEKNIRQLEKFSNPNSYSNRKQQLEYKVKNLDKAREQVLNRISNKQIIAKKTLSNLITIHPLNQRLFSYELKQNINDDDTLTVTYDIYLNKDQNDGSKTKEVEYLKQMAGHYPHDIKMLENPKLKNRLIVLIGEDRYNFMKDYWGTSGPISVKNNFYVADGCQSHNCSNTNFIIIIDLIKNTMFVGIRQEMEVETYSEDGTNSSLLIDWATQ